MRHVIRSSPPASASNVEASFATTATCPLMHLDRSCITTSSVSSLASSVKYGNVILRRVLYRVFRNVSISTLQSCVKSASTCSALNASLNSTAEGDVENTPISASTTLVRHLFISNTMIRTVRESLSRRHPCTPRGSPRADRSLQKHY